MRHLSAIVVLLLFMGLELVPAQAQTTFTQGVYHFEDTIASMTYSGTWSTITAFSPYVSVRSTSATNANVEFLASGKTLVIWRLMAASGGSSRMDVCVGASCTAIINESTASAAFFYPIFFTLPSGTNAINIERTLGTINLDYFMILNDPAVGSFPTPVPTATIVPSATPASTTTPQPTPTPQPTSTPMSVVVAIDPQRSYSSESGQITAFDYIASAGDVHIANLLTMLIFSVWGMFILVMFVLVRFRK